MSKQQSLPPSILYGHLSQQEFHAFLHNTISANITYFKAVAKYQKRKLIIYADGRQLKNEKTFCRLTETGLRLLKTGFSKKPKNPV